MRDALLIGAVGLATYLLYRSGKESRMAAERKSEPSSDANLRKIPVKQTPSTGYTYPSRWRDPFYDPSYWGRPYYGYPYYIYLHDKNDKGVTVTQTQNVNVNGTTSSEPAPAESSPVPPAEAPAAEGGSGAVEAPSPEGGESSGTGESSEFSGYSNSPSYYTDGSTVRLNNMKKPPKRMMVRAKGNKMPERMIVNGRVLKAHHVEMLPKKAGNKINKRSMF